MIQIKNRYDDSLIAEIDAASLRDAVIALVKKGVSLRYANLQSADLQYADLQYADLRSANLQSANLQSANLQYANLQYADHLGSHASHALVIARTRILPEGSLIGWKQCCGPRGGKRIVKLAIPAKARRSHAFGRKCRCEYATVLEIHGGEDAFSLHDSKFEYRVGKKVKCHEWGEDWKAECSGGVHFYLTREEAEAHG